jgi:hypothetical protein
MTAGGELEMAAIGTEIETAYRKLKSYVYYDKTDLHLRARMAKFECSDKFEANLQAVQEVADAVNPASHRRFKRWLRRIGCRVVPKKLGPARSSKLAVDEAAGKFITNVTSAPSVEVETVNYFFDGPIELHLIAVLWLMRDGRHLDAKFLPECCGSRLSPKLHDENDDSLQLFTKYHEQYSRWRDTGIRKAKQLLVEERRSVAILGLDLREYFYRVDLDFDQVREALRTAGALVDDQGDLLHCIEAIGKAYRERIAPLLERTHPDLAESEIGLPIGLCSSLVLANWYLQDFDAAVLNSVRPAYYGRYVDDILLVVSASQDPNKSAEDPVASFINEVLVRPRLLTPPVDRIYRLCERPTLQLQQSKCILQYFDARHSIAGLEKFKKKLEQNGSDFLLLPVDEADNSMEDVAYELLYEGSVNKFRSVKGVAENRYELAKHLARQTILHVVTDDPPDRKVSQGLQNFFKGRCAIEYFDLWERVFTLLGIAGDKATAKAFMRQLNAEIRRVRHPDDRVTQALVANLNQHLKLALALSDSVCEEDIGLSDLVEDVPAEEFRRANLLRHHYVRAPLLNFTTYTGPLSERTLKTPAKRDPQKLAWTPRFLNFDECMLLAYSGNVQLGKATPFLFAKTVFEAANRHAPTGVAWVADEGDTDSIEQGERI